MTVGIILSLLCGNAFGLLQRGADQTGPHSDDSEGQLLPKLLSLFSEAEALQAGNSVTRRDLLTRAASAVPLAVAAPSLATGNQDGKSADDAGAVVQAKSLIGTGASNVASRKGGVKPKIRVSGTWKDPQHPGGYRKITLVGTNVVVNGADEDGKPWKVQGQLKGNSIILDFTPKGGPKDVEGKYIVGKGIQFPDGNTWYK